jgi:bacteriorhodopsin
VGTGYPLRTPDCGIGPRLRARHGTDASQYVRYIDWVITTPALLLELVLVSGLPLSDITTIVFFDIVMIVTVS